MTVEALRMMFEIDRSAARGQMSAQALFAFQHGSALGSAPAAKLFDRVRVLRRDEQRPPRCFGDYEVVVDENDLPAGIALERLL